ncbi:acetyl esterase/lipase [Natronobacillus azotifigens]|uniref:Alpha/beta hydrolase n=1 Tax=Natronobacillus azotifigens TaxID=472978 RepID=A0A9J6RCM7_9BACI|nr:alpha/beta hydrolase [Natronobacillus azotifigens]MCZ0703052.1 alpha/beta hydrolase [Natronobacillus azotifigens]
MPLFDSLYIPLSGVEQKPVRRSISMLASTFVVLNILSVLLSIVFLYGFDIASFLTGFGVVLLLTFIGSILVAALPSNNLAMDRGYLLFSVLAMVFLPVINTFAASNPNNQSSTSWISSAIILLLLGFGTVMAWKKRTRSHSVIFGGFHQEKQSMRSIIEFIILIFCLLVGLFFAYQLLVGKTGGVVELILPGYALFFSIATLAITALLMKKKRTMFSVFLAVVGIMIAVIFSVPVVATLFSINEAEQEFAETFGESWEENISDVDHSYFLPTIFSLPNYFFGTRTENYMLKEDILFYEGTEGVDEGIELYFDAYLPTENSESLPGNRAVLIRIHGGGWTIGNKGAVNYAGVNKYFASQGYVVFDVQYGLSNEEKFVDFAPVSENVVGDFTIDDMVRHIGIFTDYLVTNNDEFNGDLDTVFVSGPSAGGQLASAVGLGLASGQYSDILNQALEVKGIIPIYPAHELAGQIGIDGSEELVDPALLVTENSPPALIFQGSEDGIVDPSIAKAFDESYANQDNERSILLMMPLAGHNSDFYFSTYYNQLLIYYMERFMLKVR